MSHLLKFPGTIKPSAVDHRYRVTGRKTSQRLHANRRAEHRGTITPPRAPVAGSVQLSAIAPRTRHFAATIHALGPNPLHELFCDLIVASPVALPIIERYAELAAYSDIIAAYGGRELPPNVRVIK